MKHVLCVLNGLSFWSTEPDRLDEYYDKNRKITFRSQIESDRRKFPLADENGDGKLNREEMAVYLHPSDFPKMRDYVVDQYFDQMDENKDGRVTREEYLGQCACLSVCQSVCTFICLWLLYTHSSLCLSVCFSVCLSLSFECVCVWVWICCAHSFKCVASLPFQLTCTIQRGMVQRSPTGTSKRRNIFWPTETSTRMDTSTKSVDTTTASSYQFTNAPTWSQVGLHWAAVCSR